MTDAIAPREPRLTREQVRELQAFLNARFDAGLVVDGELGRQLAAQAFDLHQRDPPGLPDKEAWFIQEAAFADPRSADPGWRRPPIWIFYSGVPEEEAEWLRSLRTGDTIFWIHGRHPRGGSYKNRLRAGDTVLLLVGETFVASGVLLADNELTFVDALGRIRRPVRVLERYEPPIPRSDAQVALEAPLIRQGAVHPLPAPALGQLQVAQKKYGFSSLPYPDDLLGRLLSERPLAADLQEEAPYILPDESTADVIGWTQALWRPGEEETPGAEAAPEAEAPDAEAAQPSPLKPAPVEEFEAPRDLDEDEESAQPDKTSADSQIPYVLDAPAESEDQLERGSLALFLARRLHLIWCQINGHAPGPDGERTRPSPDDADTFIAHVDSPWGGGKSTFANFVARALNPGKERLTPRHFLRSTLAATTPDDELAKIDWSTVFVPPYADNADPRWAGARRPWVVARYNAWRDQYVQPPWWQIFLSIHSEISRELRKERRFGAWTRAQFSRLRYQLWNTKLKVQVALWGLIGLLLLILGLTGVLTEILTVATDKDGRFDPGEASKLIALVTGVLGIGGASIATLFTVFSQSLSPDLDFTAEHKQIGVRDPIDRFRRAFHRIVRTTDRPILLIVDDLDRCEPETVVEILRGFQTIIRSPRLFVLLLGDRAWIEAAHDVHHRDFAAMSSGEGSLGSLYVQKVIQLSLRLPVMQPEARREFARGVLGDRPDPETAEVVNKALRDMEAKVDAVVSAESAVGRRDTELGAAREKMQADLAGQSAKTQQAAIELADRIIADKAVAAAGADTAYQRRVFNAVTQLIDCLPNNPRQIKRVFMAFATYEQVGRRMYKYQPEATGEQGELKARRWRQLAKWVTLAVEWPETWRAVARRPELLEAAYADPAERPGRDAALVAGLAEAEAAATNRMLGRLRADPALSTLLSGRGGKPGETLAPESEAFANTPMEREAIYEFNRIIWEAGFRLEDDAAA